jgi:hypothetical protein
MIGTLIEPTCASYNDLPCAIPSCPSGWADLGITSRTFEAAWGGTGGVHSRLCITPTNYLVAEPKCPYWGSSLCTIPSCPSGWLDLGITNTNYKAAYGGPYGGFLSRFCVKN